MKIIGGKGKIWLPMKLSTFFLFVAFVQVSGKALSQKLTISVSDTPLTKLFDLIEHQTGYVFFYSPDVLDDAGAVSIHVKDAALTDVLNDCLKGRQLGFSIVDKTIFIKKEADKPPGNARPKAEAPPIQILVRGRVTGTDGQPISGVTVLMKGTRNGVYTDDDGKFSMKISSDADWPVTLVFRYIGMKTQEVSVNTSDRELKIVMQMQAKALQNLVITGMFVRDKVSFTGAATTYTTDQLKAVGNKNVLESLKTLDPSFVQIVNNSRGSDPNTLPAFEIRGRTSISTSELNSQFNADPNQPLFILDGFESTLQAIYDLDMNRVASVTILKDAASTALYGAKAANGVVVVETKRPVPGELRVSYTGDFNVDMPDLRSYNLMNASEKLEFERLSGIYIQPLNNQWQADERYNERLAAVRSGVNTYWLSEPLQLGFTNRHSLQLSGGNSDLMFNAGASFGNQNGVMKGSGRQTWSGNFNMAYRKGIVNITDMLQLSGVKATASPYGDFSTFAEANPYYRKRNADGSISEYLDSLDFTMYNPLYNASLFSINQQKAFSVNNNLQAVITISNSLRLQGALRLSKGNSTDVVFIPPENTQFIGIAAHQKGSYTYSHVENFSYDGNVMLSWAKLLGKNRINANARAEVGQTSSRSTGFAAVGFPYGTDGNPSFAYQFAPYSAPSSAVLKAHNVGFLVSFNYAYDQRFFLDATYRLDGASVFGSNHLFKPFASGGIGWNINREPFLKDIRWLDLLKLRGDIGFTGNENLGQFSSVSTYVFQSGQNNFGQSLSMESLGNPNLAWQKTRQQSYGIDFGFLHNRISGYAEYFLKHTDPLVIGATGTLPSSAGINANYVMNVGYLDTKGWDFDLRVSPVYEIEKEIVWTLGITGSAYTSIYGGLGDKLTALNKQELDNNGLIRYRDGYSPDDMWAVVSEGIDPATGKELFLKKDGTLTFTYDPDDIVNIGNARPKMEGVVTSTFRYKEFTFGANIRYSWGGYIQNGALYNKVENISLSNVHYNQDKRALYNRWKKPGDVAQFKAISNTVNTPMSSRFIEKNNYFDGESFSIGYRVQNGWIKKLHMQSLSFTAYLNDIFYIESAKTERGIDYPYARTVSFSVNASF